ETKHLCGKDIVAALHTLQRAAQYGFGLAFGIDVGSVEEVDAGIEGSMHARACHVFFDLAAVRDPVAIGDLGYAQPTASQVAIFHCLYQLLDPEVIPVTFLRFIYSP